MNAMNAMNADDPNLDIDDEGADEGADDEGAPEAAPARAAQGWMRHLIRTTKGVLVKNFSNLEMIVRYHFAGHLRLNEMTHAPECSMAPGQWMPCTDTVSGRMRSEIERSFGLSYGNDAIHQAIAVVHVENPVHPVRDYLKGLVWDGVRRIADVPKALGIEASPLNTRVLHCWFLSAIARPLVPGEKVDTVLVLVGPQGSRKSTFFRALAGDWFADSHMDLTNKDAYLQLHSTWLYEWGEIEKITGTRSPDAVKAFLTSQSDTFRAPYGRTTGTYKRGGIFVGTTNDESFLSDATGNRRFWPLATGKCVDTNWVFANRDQLWAEAMNDYREWLANNPGSMTRPWVLTDAETAEMDARTASENAVGDVWDVPVADFLTSVMGVGWAALSMTDRCMREEPGDTSIPGNRHTPRPLTTGLVLSLALGIREKDHNQGNARRVANVMRTLGWRLKPARFDGKLVKSWHPDTDAAKADWDQTVNASRGGGGDRMTSIKQARDGAVWDAMLADLEGMG